MKDTFRLGTLILAFLLDYGASTKHHIGPCLVVTPSEPCPDPEYIQLYLYTRKNTENEQYVEVSARKDNLTSSYFNPKNPNKLILHGFNTDMHLDVLQDIKTEYLIKADVNIWMVNYPKLVENALCYISSVININHVGICLAQLVKALQRHESNDIHVIGFSLGAQVTNYLANALGSKNKLDRITGLDPAGPGFTLMGKKHRLDASDAKFVDVVHTNGGIQGDIQRCGDIDFYVNGGISQPGCEKTEDYLNCNHRRASQYFAESINTKVGFLGWPCKDYMDYLQGKCKPRLNPVPMGDHVPAGSSGLYIVETASEKPFALGNWTSEYYKKHHPSLHKNKKQRVSVNDPVQRIFRDTYMSSGSYIVETASEKPFSLGNWSSEYYKKHHPTQEKNKEQRVSVNDPVQRIFRNVYMSLGSYIVETASEKPFSLGNWASEYYKKHLQTLEKNKKLRVSVNDPVQRIFRDFYITKESNTS